MQRPRGQRRPWAFAHRLPLQSAPASLRDVRRIMSHQANKARRRPCSRWATRSMLRQTRRHATVRRFIGEGSQGSVYDVESSPRASTYALKWYFPSIGQAAQRDAIEELVDRGAPDDRFLWPTEIVEVEGRSSFGYVMPLRPTTTSGLSDLLTGKVDVAVLDGVHARHGARRQLPRAAQPGPLLSRHQLRQRVLRSPDGSPAHLRQRQRRRRRRVRFARAGNPTVHGARDRSSATRCRAPTPTCTPCRCCSSTS